MLLEPFPSILAETRYNGRASSNRPTRTHKQTMPNSMNDRQTIAPIDEPCQIYRIDELEESTTLCLVGPRTLHFKPELAISLIEEDEIEEDEDDDTEDGDDEDFDADGLDEDEDDEDEDDEDDAEVEPEPDSE
jgi:hypothetical protein